MTDVFDAARAEAFAAGDQAVTALEKKSLGAITARDLVSDEAVRTKLVELTAAIASAAMRSAAKKMRWLTPPKSPGQSEMYCTLVYDGRERPPHWVLLTFAADAVSEAGFDPRGSCIIDHKEHGLASIAIKLVFRERRRDRPVAAA